MQQEFSITQKISLVYKKIKEDLFYCHIITPPYLTLKKGIFIINQKLLNLFIKKIEKSDLHFLTNLEKNKEFKSLEYVKKLGQPCFIKNEILDNYYKNPIENFTLGFKNYYQNHLQTCFPVHLNLWGLNEEGYSIVFVYNDYNEVSIKDANNNILYYENYIYFDSAIYNHPDAQQFIKTVSHYKYKEHKHFSLNERITLKNGTKISWRKYLFENLSAGANYQYIPHSSHYQKVFDIFKELNIDFFAFKHLHKNEDFFLYGKTLFLLDHPQFFDIVFSKFIPLFRLGFSSSENLKNKMEDYENRVKLYFKHKELLNKLIDKPKENLERSSNNIIKI